MTPADIVRYWRSVELLQPQAAPKLKKREMPHQSYIHDVSVADPVMPWDQTSKVLKEPLPKGKVWSHLLFAHCYDFKCAVKALEDVFGADQGYAEPQSQIVALYALKLTHTGAMVADSLVLSSAAWLLARVRAGEDWARSFDETQDKVRAVATEHLAGVVTADKIVRLTNWIVTYFGLRDFFRGAAVLPSLSLQTDQAYTGRKRRRPVEQFHSGRPGQSCGQPGAQQQQCTAKYLPHTPHREWPNRRRR